MASRVKAFLLIGNLLFLGCSDSKDTHEPTIEEGSSVDGDTAEKDSNTSGSGTHDWAEDTDINSNGDTDSEDSDQEGAATNDDTDSDTGTKSSDGSDGSDADADVDSETQYSGDAGSVPCQPGDDNPNCLSEGRDLSDYVSDTVKKLTAIPREASGITWNGDTHTFFVVANLQGALWEYDEELETALRKIEIKGMNNDTEGIVYLGGNKFAIAVETNNVIVTTIDENTTVIDGSSASTSQTYQPTGSPPVNNAGFEGIAYRPPRDGAPGRIYVCQEHLPMRVLYFEYLPSDPPYERKSYADGTLEIYEPWNAKEVFAGVATDLAGMSYDATSDTLLIVSEESSKLMRVDPESGAILETKALSNLPQYEGITLFEDSQMALVSEPNQVELFQYIASAK